MITNLLGKNVLYDGKDWKICAIYQHEDNIFYCLVSEEGQLTKGLPSYKFRINEQNNCSVVIYWTPERKIHGIKTVREVTGLGLREAKDLVEGNPSGVPIKSGLTHAEAKEILRIITQNGMEGQIIKR
jgi:ribosomal protein L7/L12